MEKKRADNNLVSSVLLFKYGHFKLLFGGDTHKKTYKECFEAYEVRGLKTEMEDYASHFIKASHHGSKNSSTIKIWERLIDSTTDYPIHIAFSAGAQYKHPSKLTLEHIQKVQEKHNLDIRCDASNAFLPHGHYSNYPFQSLDWLYEEDTEHHDFVVREGLGRMSKKGAIPTNNKEAIIAAFVYEFNPKNQEIMTILGVSKLLNDEKKHRQKILWNL